MSGVLYNPAVEQRLVGIAKDPGRDQIEPINRLLGAGWQVASLVPAGSGGTYQFLCLLERRTEDRRRTPGAGSPPDRDKIRR